MNNKVYVFAVQFLFSYKGNAYSVCEIIKVNGYISFGRKLYLIQLMTEELSAQKRSQQGKYLTAVCLKQIWLKHDELPNLLFAP